MNREKDMSGKSSTGTRTKEKLTQEGSKTPSGQTEAISLVLVFGVSFVAIGIILSVGLPTIDDARENAQVERIQTEFATFNQELRESIYTPSESGASISLEEGGVRTNSSAMEVTIRYINNSPAIPSIKTATLELGGFEYEENDAKVSYQSGGVWTTSGNGGYSMQTPPDISYSDQSLSMNLINITSDVTFTGSGADATFDYRGTFRERIPENTTNRSLSEGTLEIDIESDQDDGWREYFNRTFGEENVAGTDNGVAELELETGPPLFGVEYLKDRFEDTGGPPLPVCGPPPPSPAICSNNKIVTAYDSGISSEDRYNYTFDSSGSPITPLPVTTSDINECRNSPDGSDSPLPGPGSTVPAGDYRPGGTTNLDGHTFDTTSGKIRYLTPSGTDVDINNNPVTFDTTGGPVEIHVSGDFNLNADVLVNGSSPVYIYVGGDTRLDNPVSVDVKNNRTGLFQLYTSTGSSIDVQANYNGTVYAPNTDININSGVFRGAAIAGSSGTPVEVSTGADYFHDSSLRRAELPDCINPPLTNFNAVERRIEMR